MKNLSLVYRIKEALVDNKLLVLMSTSVYWLGLILGVILSHIYISTTKNFDISIMNENKLILQNSSFFCILENNGKVIIFLITGLFSLGFSTFISLIYNGLFLGAMLVEYIKAVSFTKILLLIVPHAIFELPALWTAGAAGFKIPYDFLKYLKGENNYFLKRKEVIDFVILVCLSICLIFIAAFIESYITIKFMKF
jgi:Uncharacterized membrane protein